MLSLSIIFFLHELPFIFSKAVRNRSWCLCPQSSVLHKEHVFCKTHEQALDVVFVSDLFSYPKGTSFLKNGTWKCLWCLCPEAFYWRRHGALSACVYKPFWWQVMSGPLFGDVDMHGISKMELNNHTCLWFPSSTLPSNSLLQLLLFFRNHNFQHKYLDSVRAWTSQSQRLCPLFICTQNRQVSV